MKFKSYILQAMLVGACAGTVCSCEDMLNMDSDYVIYSDEDHLNTPADTANSLLGIIYRLQAIGDRTNLLGEVRGDLVTLRTAAHADLHELANCKISDDNKYNNPRDYYNVINNCNYYLAYADTALRDNRNNLIFEKEYAQVKAIRAWTYLQLALNYGKVPFYTEPILKESDVDKVTERRDLQQICDYFINDLLPERGINFPSLKTIGSVYMANCYFPVEAVLGDLYLWRASKTQSQQDYWNAAECYYSWIIDGRTIGDGSKKEVYKTSLSYDMYLQIMDGSSEPAIRSTYNGMFSSAVNTYSPGDLVTMIPMDSASSAGYYSEVKGLYNSDMTTMSEYVIYPSQHMQAISQAQKFCTYDLTEQKYEIAPVFEDNALYNGDLRLYANWDNGSNYMFGGTLEDFNYQQIQKVNQRHIWVYRKTDMYLRLAEAMNNAGYPRFAYAILATGLSGSILRDSIASYYSESDSIRFENLFNKDNIIVRDFVARDGYGSSSPNNMGIHSRGSGYTEMNPAYRYPADSTIYWSIYNEEMSKPENQGAVNKDSLNKVIKRRWSEQGIEGEKLRVDSLILNEMALESCFEGKRYYDLMRFGFRHGAEWLADPISRRNSTDGTQDPSMYSYLLNMNNWYMSWKNKIGPNM